MPLQRCIVRSERTCDLRVANSADAAAQCSLAHASFAASFNTACTSTTEYAPALTARGPSRAAT